jgi:hypothetical protein
MRAWNHGIGYLFLPIASPAGDGRLFWIIRYSQIKRGNTMARRGSTNTLALHELAPMRLPLLSFPRFLLQSDSACAHCYTLVVHAASSTLQGKPEPDAMLPSPGKFVSPLPISHPNILNLLLLLPGLQPLRSLGSLHPACWCAQNPVQCLGF